MPEKTEKIALALEPKTENFGTMPLMIALAAHLGDDPWMKARQIALDLEMIAPQIVWLEAKQQKRLKAKLDDMDIESRIVSHEEADKISCENKPVYGTIDLHIRTRDWKMKPDLIRSLRDKKLISGYRKGDNADEIFHWKDDRWYQDYHLAIFKEEDIAQIEPLIRAEGFIIVRSD